MSKHPRHTGNLIVLSLVGGGLVVILLSIIGGLFFSPRAQVLPNWAENVLVSIATAAALKVGDVLAALVALDSGRQVETLGQQLAISQPQPAPENAKEAAQDVADAAQHRADLIGPRDIPEPSFGPRPEGEP